VVQTVRAAPTVTPVSRFVAGQIAGGGTNRYSLRATGAAVYLRHTSRDVDVLTEIFGGGREGHLYEPPRAMRVALEGDEALRIVDLGGNIGLFGAFALHRWRVHTLESFEPDPGNAALLRAAIDANGFGGRWVLHEKAVSNTAGSMPFWTGLFSESRVAPPGEAALDVEMVDLFDLGHDNVDLLKIDIEGGEWAILGDSRFEVYPARALVMEWHAWMCPSETPHETARELLSRAGWHLAVDAPSDTAPVGTIWALRD
jgi:FkbM family methyltransferase